MNKHVSVASEIVFLHCWLLPQWSQLQDELRKAKHTGWADSSNSFRKRLYWQGSQCTDVYIYTVYIYIERKQTLWRNPHLGIGRFPPDKGASAVTCSCQQGTRIWAPLVHFAETQLRSWELAWTVCWCFMAARTHFAESTRINHSMNCNKFMQKLYCTSKAGRTLQGRTLLQRQEALLCALYLVSGFFLRRITWELWTFGFVVAMLSKHSLACNPDHER